ncbi:hypothetical protein Tco_1057359 [Tanacetum coccineum]|uniref:Uncharacterized protein n=1 Tax=Tanacetum coccineum TaxID=301880 RepID=A0ABQ5H6Z0_9ASTR
MLETGRYEQWAIRFLRYIDTRPNVCLQKVHLIGPYTPTMVTTPAVWQQRILRKKRFIDVVWIGDEFYSKLLMACHGSSKKCGESIERLQQATRYKGKEIAKPITPPSESASEEDSDPEQAQKDKDMQKNLALIAKYFKKQNFTNSS